ncbi:unnamed protein product [Adineta ricciae]|uniref:Calcineurin-like phosphoesterase domain-containing protein n=1 Tax=Adineta ricciae TaxID=249248 RepID=A0A816G266_ADIRI|nr:unnamed protein product [Adineta ricciae]
MAEAVVEIEDKPSSSITRFVCISDNHDNYDFVLPPGDILLHSGDFTHNGTEKEVLTFLNWLKTLTQYRLKIVIVGNHEWKRFYTKKRYKKLPPAIEQLKTDKSLISDFGIVYLQESSFQDPITGWKFYGSGWLSEHCKDSKEIHQHWFSIPTDTDILLTHGPPNGILDKSMRGTSIGCKELFQSVTTSVKPKLHVFGHVHASYGQMENEDEFGRTVFINASICDSYFRTAHSPIVIDLNRDD